MAKKIQLTIPEPCHENWNIMTPVDKGRFCGSCQKQVVDFSNMSDREVAQFFKKPSTGSVCGRFMQDQLDRDMEIPKKRIPWIKYFFQIALPAFLLSAKAKAQGEVRIKKEQCVVTDKEILGDTIPSYRGKVAIANVIRGKVVNERHQPLPGASIVIKGTKIGTTSDNAGDFRLTVKDITNDIVLVTSYVGFSILEKKIKKENFAKEDKIILMALNTQLAGEVVVIAGYVSRKKVKSKAKPIPIIPEIKDTATKTFKVYPNPASSGSNVNLEWKEKEEGYYTVQLLNQSGQVVFTKEIWIDAEARVLNLDLPSVTVGGYFIRVTNKKSGKNSTEKIIIQ